MSGPKLILAVVVLAALVIVPQAIFTVHVTERAILRQLGEIKRSDYEPGLHWKIPVVQNVLKFDARIQSLDSDPELYLTSEKKNVSVDSFVKWRVKNVDAYYTSTGGNERTAGLRLSEVLRKRLKDEFGKRTIIDVVAGERSEIMEVVTVALNDYANELGIEIVDVRIKRIDLPQEVSSSVFQRMQAERQEVAKTFAPEAKRRQERFAHEQNGSVKFLSPRQDETLSALAVRATQLRQRSRQRLLARRRFLRAISFFERVPSQFWWQSRHLADEARFRVLSVLQRPKRKAVVIGG